MRAATVCDVRQWPHSPQIGQRLIGTRRARVGSIKDNRLGSWVSYRASKAALNQILRTVALELGISHRLLVVAALQPGTVATRLSAPYRSRAPEVLTPEYAAGRLLEVLDGLEPAQSGDSLLLRRTAASLLILPGCHPFAPVLRRDQASAEPTTDGWRHSP